MSTMPKKAPSPSQRASAVVSLPKFQLIYGPSSNWSNSNDTVGSSIHCDANAILMSPKDIKQHKLKVGSYIVLKQKESDGNFFIGRLWLSKTLPSGVVLINALWKLHMAKGSSSSCSSSSFTVSSIRSTADVIFRICKQVVLCPESSRSETITEALIESRMFYIYVSESISNVILSVGMNLLINWKNNKLILKVVDLLFDETSDNGGERTGKFDEKCSYLSITRDKICTKSGDCTLPVVRASLPPLSFDHFVEHLEEASGYLRLALSPPRGSSSLLISELFKPPRGLLLHGPRGTGKTTLMRQLVTASCCAVVELHQDALLTTLAGDVEGALNELFERAKRLAPTCVMIDDIDSLLADRAVSMSSEQGKRTVSCLLSIIDGLSSDHAVFIVATSSNPNAIDPALRRPGRIDKEIELAIPNQAQRQNILLSLYKSMIEDVASPSGGAGTLCKELAAKTDGMVLSDLILCYKEAYHLAIKKRGETVDDTFVDALSSLSISTPSDSSNKINVTTQQFLDAVKRIHPSAISELVSEIPNVFWGDIGGMSAVKAALQEVVEWPRKYSQLFVSLSLSPPRGVLLYGPPGCSKTLMAKALATESSLNFLAVKGPELLSKYLGESEKAIQKIFRQARLVAPSIIFFDEIDALATRRSSATSSGVNDRILSQLLTEMDGINNASDVIVIAATNRPDTLDPALMRPGRIDRKIYVPPPDEDSRRQIFLLELRNKPTSSDIDVDTLVKMSSGLSGAEVVAVCSEAAMLAIDSQLLELSQSLLVSALHSIEPQIDAQMLHYYENLQKLYDL